MIPMTRQQYFTRTHCPNKSSGSIGCYLGSMSYSCEILPTGDRTPSLDAADVLCERSLITPTVFQELCEKCRTLGFYCRRINATGADSGSSETPSETDNQVLYHVALKIYFLLFGLSGRSPRSVVKGLINL